jgi:hypothetical protein
MALPNWVGRGREAPWLVWGEEREGLLVLEEEEAGRGRGGDRRHLVELCVEAPM